MLQISPQRSVARVELDRLFRLRVVHLFVEQEPHRRRTATINDELDAILMENGAVRQHVGELERRVDVSHEHEVGLDRRGRSVERSSNPPGGRFRAPEAVSPSPSPPGRGPG